MTSQVVLAIGHSCPSNSNLAQYAPESVSVWHNDGTAFVGMVVTNDYSNVLDISKIDLEAIKRQFADYRKAVEKIAGDHEWKSLDDRHDWFELFNSGEPQIVVMAK